MKIYFVTSNKFKFKEVKRVLGPVLIMKKLDVPEIQAIGVKDVVEDKAKRAYRILKKPLIVEDTGLYIKSLNGFPGAFARWFFDTVGNERLCRMLENFEDRSAYSETCICFYDGKKSRVFSGRGYGKIVKRPRGHEGWGYDSVFQPRGYTKTFGEMSMARKNAISMRAKAARKLRRAIDSSRA